MNRSFRRSETAVTERMRTAVALGSNIGDRIENLRAARNSILDLPNVKAPIFPSAVYETEPVGCEPGAGKFLNAVVEFEYEGDPARLLGQLIQIEEALGVALFERREGMKDDRSSCQVQKLLRPIARHPAARSGGGNNRGVH